jgi:hypothetical protein
MSLEIEKTEGQKLIIQEKESEHVLKNINDD